MDAVSITLNVRDNATPGVVNAVRQQNEEINKLRKGAEDLRRASSGAGEAGTTFGKSFREAGAVVRLLGQDLAQTVNPALGSVVSAATAAGRAASGLGLGLGAVVVAGAAISAAIGTAVQSMEAMAQSQARLNLAVRAGDIGRARTEMRGFAETLEGLQVESPINKVRNLGLAVSGFIDRLLGLPPAMNEITRAQEGVGRAGAAVVELLPLERARALNQALADQAAALQAVRSVEASRAQETGQLEAYRAKVAEVTTEFLRQSTALRGALENEIALVSREAEARGAKPAELAALAEVGQAQIKAFELGQDAKLAALQEAVRRALASMAVTIGQQRAAFTGAEDLTVNPDFTGALRGMDEKQAVQRLDLRRQELTILQSTVGLTREEHEALQLQTIELSRQVELKQAMGVEEKIALADLRARVQSQNIVRAQLERTDPQAGLAAGFREAHAAVSEQGTILRDWALATSRDMTTAFSDGFFASFTGQFKELPNIARQFSQAILREITDVMAKAAVAPILNLFRGAVSSGQGMLRSFLPGAATTVGGTDAGTQFLVGSGGRLISEAEVARAYEVGGQPAVTALTSGRIASASEADALMGGTVAPLAQPSTVNLGQYLGPLASTALLSITAAGAYQGTRTTQDVLMNAGMGALIGAQLGVQAAGALGASGTAGGVTGAVIGAAILAGISLYGKQQADKAAKKERQQAEVARAAGGGQDLVTAAGRARNLPEFFDIITSFGSGSVGGTSPVAVPVTVQTPTGPRMIGQPNATYPVASVEDILANPQSLQANIQAGVSPESLAGPNAATSTALQAMAAALAAQFRETQEGVGVTTTDQLPGGLTRRTTVPESLADRLAGGTGTIGIESPGFEGLDDADKELLLRDLHRIAADRDMRVFVRDPETDQLVTTMMVAPTSPAGTPVGGTPGVPPGAVAPIQQAAALNLPRFPEPPPRGPAIFAPVQVWQQSGEGGMLVETGETQPTGRFSAPSAEQLADYEARKVAFYAPYAEQLSADTKAQLAALTPANIQGAIQAGLLTPQGVAALVRAGLLPNITELLPPETLAEIMAAGDAGGDAGVPGEVGEASGIPDSPFSEAATQGLIAALSSATFGLSGLVAPSNLSGVQSGLAGLLGLAGMLAGIPGLGAVAAGTFGFLNSLATQADLTTEFGLANTAPHADVAAMVANAVSNFPDNVVGLSESGFNVGQLAADFAANPTSFSNPQSWAEFFGLDAAPAAAPAAAPTGLGDLSDPGVAQGLGIAPAPGDAGAPGGDK